MLADLDALRLELAAFAYENTALRIHALQADLRQQQADLQAALKKLEQPGYTLTRTSAAQLAFVPAGAV